MPRALPPLLKGFVDATTGALRLAEKSELARVQLLGAPSTARLGVDDITMLYEVSYLRIFVAWEDFLDRAFVYYLCGRSNSLGVQSLAPGLVYARTIVEAESRAYGNQSYALWHNPVKVITRASRFFDSGLIQSVVSSDVTTLAHFGAVRHRIAHGHDDSRTKFDAATMAMCAKRFRGGRPGRFLRDNVAHSNPPMRWLEKIAGDLLSLAQQIAP